MAILTGKELLKPFIKKSSGYIKSLLSADHVEMRDQSTLQKTVDGINDTLTMYPKYVSGTYNNERYECTKFSNGDMILRQSIYFVIKNFHQWGVLWESDLQNYGKFAVPFTTIPFITATNIATTGIIVENIYNTTPTDIGMGFLVRPNQVSNLSCRLNFTAIGRWK